jgi:hypothetical protein
MITASSKVIHLTVNRVVFAELGSNLLMNDGLARPIGLSPQPVGSGKSFSHKLERWFWLCPNFVEIYQQTGILRVIIA